MKKKQGTLRKTKSKPIKKKSEELVVVGIGASAGGLEALRTLFSGFTANSSASYIVVQHVSPKSKSLLAELLARETNIAVVEATKGLKLEANRIYVTPPNVDIIVRNGRIELEDLENRSGPKPSIDRLFTSLASEYRENVVGCILSGTGSDGAQGIKAIKEAGGVTIAQNPQTAKYDGMPLAAINTGIVDLVLSAEEIGTELEKVSDRLYRDQSGLPVEFPLQPYESILKRLSRYSGVPFSFYKNKTLNRRINRRMAATNHDTIESYADFLKDHDEEVGRLFQDMLISVTSFFRDTQEFDCLRDILKDYLIRHKNNNILRVWSAGCASGEETYSLAILIFEILASLEIDTATYKIQIFATDINEKAMQFARRGFFSSASMDNIDPGYLRKYFQPSDGGYQIKKFIRETVVFAKHDLINGPPFMKMDLICCRNVFIYFEPAAQDKILKTFHHALNPDGLLFLGKSETIGKLKSHFESLDAHAKVYKRDKRQSEFQLLRDTVTNRIVPTPSLVLNTWMINSMTWS